MWYFSWILGIGLAVSFAILNAMWLEVEENMEPVQDPHDGKAPSDVAPKY
jgi:cyd operon protein YbgT